MPPSNVLEFRKAFLESSAYAFGVADGEACRKRAEAPSSFRLVARADPYSAGFRAGYFGRAPATTAPVAANFAR